MEVIMLVAAIVVAVFVIRLFGAWMLRIDEIIRYQRETLAELKKLGASGGAEE